MTDVKAFALAILKRRRGDLIGRRFGRLFVIARAGSVQRATQSHSLFLCVCACGAEKIILGASLRQKKSRSCGCAHREGLRKRNRKHGLAARGKKLSPELVAYYGAKDRCRSDKNKAFHNYGGRGIEFRFTSFKEFIDHIGKKPSSELSLDRTDNDGHYEKGNVRWASSLVQNNNRRKRII